MITSSKPMKRALLCMAVLAVAALLAGCPIYSSQSDYRVCTGSTCYDCPDPNYSNMCVPWACSADSDCASGYSCASAGQCIAGSGDDAAPPADCSVSGCPANQVCLLTGGMATCVLLGADGSTEDGGLAEDATAPIEAQVEASAASEASIDAPPLVSQDASVDGSSEASASDAATTPPADAVSEALASVACNANGDCSVGSWCIDGQCVVAGELCSDGSQCEVQGEACVNGVCVPRCSAGAPCPTGYACDFGLGVCDVNPAACTGGGTSSCQGGAVCVESHCVPPCAAGDAGAVCPGGQACVNGGCIPDQKALFACRNDGASGQLANTCDPASVCVHHDCYTACDGDGGGCPTAQCKQVTVRAGTYAVCGSPTTLGSDCDLAAGATCPSSGVCVDGYCR